LEVIEMKLAEALILRADCQKRVEQLKQRLIRSAKVQEGDEPAENPQELIVELERVSDELVVLIKRINKTNSASQFREDATLSDALAERDVLSTKRFAYNDLAHAAAIMQSAYTRSEVKFKSTVTIADVQKRADALAKEYREMDSRIQEANWRIDVVE
jgi:uncharacterized protein DUF6847